MSEPRRRRPGEAAPSYDDFDGLFSVQIHHKGFFCGSESNKTYMDYEVDWFDMFQSDTWSMLWIKDFLSQLGYDMESSKIDVYWCQSGKTIADGLKLLTCDADMVLMITAIVEHKNLLLVVDHGETLQSSDDDVMITGVTELPKVITPTKPNGKENVSWSEKGKSPRKNVSRKSKRRMSYGEGSSSGFAATPLE